MIAPIFGSITRPLLSPLVSGLRDELFGAFTPRNLFADGSQGVAYDLYNQSSLYVDDSRTTQVESYGDGIGAVSDLSGNGNHATQATGASKAKWRSTYAEFDGSNDFWVTPSIDFSGTDKVTVIAAVRKSSDAASAIILELSTATDTNNGSFRIGAPLSSGSVKFAFTSKGTSLGQAQSSSADYNAPINATLMGVGDISGDKATLFIDGVQVSQDLINQGTGNFGNYPLYIGRRAGTSLAFNGRIYRIIVIGRLLTDQEKASVQNWAKAFSGSRLRFGNRIASVGDSTMRGGWSSDSEPGVDGSTLTACADSWISHMCYTTGQRLTRIANFGDNGAKVADLDASFSTLVLPKKPDAVIISGGTNDAAATPATDSAAYKTSVESMIQKALAAGIIPILATPLPYDVYRAPTLLEYIAKLNELAAQYKLNVIDFYNYTLDPATNGYRAEFGGDGVHPDPAGARLMGKYAASVLSGSAVGVPPILATTGSESWNLVSNPLFAGTPDAYGVAPSWLRNGALPAGCVASVVEQDGVVGKMQKLTAIGTADQGVLEQTISGAWSVGDVIEVSFRFVKTGSAKSSVWLNGTGSSYDIALGTILDSEGVATAYLRVPVRAGTTALRIQIFQAAGTGSIAVGQMTVRNLTALGVL